MPDTKITALTAIGANPIIPSTFPIPMVDLTDTSMAASGTTKKVTVNQILGAGGTATLASATISGDLTVRSGNKLKLFRSDNAISTDFSDGGSGVGTIINNLNIDGFRLRLGGNNVYNVAGDGTYTQTWFNGAGGTWMTLNSTGLGVGVVPSAGKGALQLSSGINFPATQVASSDANTLDDYEEGTWTGTLKGGITDPTIPVTSTGQYTKIGNQVFARILFANVTTTGASGAISITGLPFANGSNRTIGSTLCDLIATFTGSPICWVGGTGTTLNFQASNSNAAASDLTHNAGVGRYFYVSITYTV